MTDVFAFTDASRLPDGRTLRHMARFPQALLHADAVCRVANSVSERLTSLFAAPVSIELIEPVSLKANMHARLFGGAHVVRARGDAGDAFVILRQSDARSLIDRAFTCGAIERSPALSTLESRLLRQVSGDIAAACGPLCGTLGKISAETAREAAHEASVYFEMRLMGSMRASIGIAVAHAPRAGPQRVLRPSDLGGVRIQARAVLGRGVLTCAAIARLKPGAVVPLDTALDNAGTLEIDGRAIARGRCGIDGNHFAFQITEVPGGTREDGSG